MVSRISKYPNYSPFRAKKMEKYPNYCIYRNLILLCTSRMLTAIHASDSTIKSWQAVLSTSRFKSA
jgi:hypothetical protein